jgi:RHS repeat-associated protein
MGYFTNTKAGIGMDVESKLKDNIKLFTFPSIATTIDAQTVVIGLYDANVLMVNISTDENGNKMAECKDKEGRVVCKRVQNANQVGTLEIVETNYAYDDFGLLRFVFQPKATPNLFISTTAITPLTNVNLQDLVFAYNYDTRLRLIEKKVPGMVKTEMVYDKRDRVVYMIDGWGRTLTATTGQTKGVYSRYDELDRAIESGYYTVIANQNCGTPAANSSTNPRAYLQCSFDLMATANFDFFAGALAANKVAYLNNYYDVYPSGDAAKFNLSHAYSQPVLANVTGMMVKSIDKVLFNNAPIITQTNILNTNVTSIMFYDNLGRSIQTVNVNHTTPTTPTLLQLDYASSQLDFAGRVITSKSTTNYTWRPSSGATTALTPIVIENKTTYDYGGRVASICQKNDADTWEPLARNSYSKIGELLGKKMGCDIQNVDYQYNIRSWLTKINDPANLAGNNRDLFGLNLTYQNGLTPQYNGNITKLEWNTLSKLDNVAVPKGLQQYDYTYDKMNRLQTANFSSGQAPLQAIGISVAMGNGTNSYDVNGNILFMKRTVNGTLVDNLTYTYDKSGLSNRLMKIADGVTLANANYFVDGANTTDDYTYNANGNMITDLNKSINSIVYNHANLPAVITNNSAGTNKGMMKYYYTFTGKKVRTEVLDGSTTIFTNAKTIEYVNGLAFKGGALEFIPTATGRALSAKYVWSNTTTATALTPPVAPANQYRYEYQLKDHLSDLRVSCRCGDPKRNAAGDMIAGLEPTMAVQENHYDPWGLGFADAINNTQKPPKNTDRFQYNGKEKVSDLGLGLYEYGFRWYDPTMARFVQVDPLAEKFPHWTTYQYTGNSPIVNIDMDGLEPINVFDINSMNDLSWYMNIEYGKDKNGKFVNVSQNSYNGTTVSDKFYSNTIQQTSLKNASIMDIGDVISGVGVSNIIPLQKMDQMSFKSKNPFGLAIKQISDNMAINAGYNPEGSAYGMGLANMMLHVAGQALFTVMFGESTANLAGHIHETGQPSLFTGKFSNNDDLKYAIDNYADLINNQWGQKLGMDFVKNNNITSRTSWTPDLTANFFNSIQNFVGQSSGKNFNSFSANDTFIKQFSAFINIMSSKP